MIKPYYTEKDIVIYCGDCLKILPQLEDKSVDLVVTSPPYKNSYEGIGITKGTKTQKFHYFNDVGEPLYLIEDVGKILLPKLKDNGKFLLNLGFNKDSGALRPFYIIERLLKNGWFCPDKIIWHKKNPIPNTSNQLTNSFEYIFILTKIPTYNLCSRGKPYIHNVWDLSIDSGSTDHNAAFPLELPIKCIELFSNPNNTILDMFAGSGTTLLAATQLKRFSIGIEINPKYCDIAIQRLKAIPGRMFK